MSEAAGNALVIGGTGMLAGATSAIVKWSDRTLLVARHATDVANGHPTITPVDADWNYAEFEGKVTEAIWRFPPIRRALIWLHNPQPILEWLMPLLDGALSVIVLGSLDSRPELPNPVAGDCVFVQLGSKSDSGRRRWLTHEEISEAALHALLDGKSRVVGDLR